MLPPNIFLEIEQIELLSELTEAQLSLPRHQRQDFIYKQALTRAGSRSIDEAYEILERGESLLIGGAVITRKEELPQHYDRDIIFHPGLPNGSIATIQSDVDALRQQNLIEFRHPTQFTITIEGLRFDNELNASKDKKMPNTINKEPDPRQVFVVYGRNSQAKRAMFEFLRSLDLSPLEWESAVSLTGSGSPSTLEVIDAGMKAAQAVVVLLTGDDWARLQEEFHSDNEPKYEIEDTAQARPNVIFEAGIAFGRSRDRTILVEFGNLRPFSDVSGINTVRFRGDASGRIQLIERLKTAGCSINQSGDHWLTTGDFTSAMTPNSKFELWAG